MNRFKPAAYILFILLSTTASAFAASDDILSIDPKHLGILIAIFVASIVLLNKLLFQPLLELDEKREQLTSGTSSEAKDLKQKAEATINEYNEKINEARIETQEQRNLIRKEAQSSAAEMMERARADAGSLLEEAKTKIDNEADAIREKIKPEIELIAKDVASKLINKEI
ncbi:MAG: ATP synthase F0 subunit B [Candidatus Dadabacteria bacterium]|nr:ATP synthase F0 subunit B [Candidatus Dadabacteria bacterium]NIS07928.1 ATP synthase F0 subunit B [Candidatus Dadabacteria bacterium]NIY21512.1 hypothetical protein [Candidatus Dadabacteria bacterium]